MKNKEQFCLFQKSRGFLPINFSKAQNVQLEYETPEAAMERRSANR